MSVNISKEYFLICENTLKSEDNKISVINIFDSINGDSLPLVFGPCSLAGSFVFTGSLKKEASYPIDLKLYNPKGKIVNDLGVSTETFKVAPFEGQTKLGFSFNMPALILEDEGTYEFKVVIGNCEAQTKLRSQLGSRQS